MKKRLSMAILTTMILMLSFSLSWAHFGMIIPSDDIVSKQDKKEITLQIKFLHPFEGHYMNMEMPKAFGVVVVGKKENLLNTLKKKD
jgi:cobalt/nickel transport protein